MNVPADSVESFLHAVGADLPMPDKQREAILAELRDGLLEATDSHERTGLDRAQAAAVAMQEFGDPQAVAESFKRELIVACVRQSAVTLLSAAPIVLALWMAAARSRDASPPAHLFDSSADHLAAALLLAALVASGIGTLLITGRLTRWLALPPLAPVISAATMGLITVISDLLAVTVLGVRLASYPGMLHMLLLTAAITASCTGAYLGTRAGRSCLAIVKLPP